MVDNLTPQDPGMATGEQTPIVDEPKQGFLSTTTGKLVAILGAVFAFLVIAGIVAFVVMTFFVTDVIDDVGQQLSDQVGSEASQDGSSEDTVSVVATEPGLVPLNSIFTFRDVFEPLIKPEPAEEPTATDGITDGNDPTDGATSGMENTVYLQDVVVEDGVSKAVLLYNGATYTLAAGESIPDTPWQVLSVYSGSVTMLYGDSQVTLVVGQGVANK